MNRTLAAALGLAKKTLNQYYSQTDDSETYLIAMSKLLKFTVFTF